MIYHLTGLNNFWATNVRTKKRFFVCGGYQQNQVFILLLRKVGAKGFRVNDLVSFSKSILSDLSFGVVLDIRKYTKLYAFAGISGRARDSILKNPTKVRTHRLVKFKLVSTFDAFQYASNKKRQKRGL